MDDLQDTLEARWASIFGALAAGEDVPPTLRLRAEGMMEAVVLLGLASQEELVETMDRCYRVAFGCNMVEDFGQDWREFYPFPQIPAVGRRAPVYPSTRD